MTDRLPTWHTWPGATSESLTEGEGGVAFHSTMQVRSFAVPIACFLLGAASTYVLTRSAARSASEIEGLPARARGELGSRHPSGPSGPREVLDSSDIAPQGQASASPAVHAAQSVQGDFEDYKDIDKETDPDRLRWRTMRMTLQEYRKKEKKVPLGVEERGLLDTTLAMLLHEQGRGELNPDLKLRLRQKRNDEYFMVFNGEGFLFSASEFPEYVNWVEYNRNLDEYQSAIRHGRQWSRPIPAFDESNFVWLENMASSTLKTFESNHPQCKPTSK